MDAMCKSKPASTEEAGCEAGEDNVLHTELKIAQDELDTMAKLNSRLGYEIKRNELALSNMMKNYDSIQYTLDCSRKYVIKAQRSLEKFPESSLRQTLFELAEFIVSREV